MQTDYWVIGAGAMGLAFADEMLTRSDAHITLVDKRAAPVGIGTTPTASCVCISLLGMRP
jgi:L-2-hydroxyglutarate oxidase LhgO